MRQEAANRDDQIVCLQTEVERLLRQVAAVERALKDSRDRSAPG